MFKVDFVMDKHSGRVCRSKVWNLLGIASRVWPAVSCQVPCVGGGSFLLCATIRHPWHRWSDALYAKIAIDQRSTWCLWSNNFQTGQYTHMGRHKKWMLRGNRWRRNSGRKIAPCWETASPEGSMSEQGGSKRQGSMEENVRSKDQWKKMSKKQEKEGKNHYVIIPNSYTAHHLTKGFGRDEE